VAKVELIFSNKKLCKSTKPVMGKDGMAVLTRYQARLFRHMNEMLF